MKSDWEKIYKFNGRLINLDKIIFELTRWTASRAARAVISAHETTLPHLSCTSSRRSSMISKAFFLRLRFGGASCSLGPLCDPSSNTEPSHPYIIYSTSKFNYYSHPIPSNIQEIVCNSPNYNNKWKLDIEFKNFYYFSYSKEPVVTVLFWCALETPNYKELL